MRNFLLTLFVFIVGFVNSQTKITVTHDTVCFGQNKKIISVATSLLQGTTYKWKNIKLGTEINNDTLELDASKISEGEHIWSFIYKQTDDKIDTLEFILVVKPSASIQSMTSEICSGVAFNSTPVNSTNGIVPNNTKYSWSVPSVINDSIKGGTEGLNSTNISGTLTNTTNTDKTATYTVTPSSGTCSGAPFTVTVTVNPKAIISPMTNTVCSGDAFTSSPFNVTNGVVPKNTTYSWSDPSVTKDSITGGKNGSNSTNISGTLTNSTNTVKTATYTVTPSSGTCTGATFTVIVTVNPKPSISSMTNTVCSGDAFVSSPFNATNGVVPNNTTYSWSDPSVTKDSITGGKNGSNSTNISGTLTNSTNTVKTATYTVTPSSGTCSGAPFTVTVTVNPKPSISPMTNTAKDSICEGSKLVLSIPYDINSDYQWSRNGEDIPGAIGHNFQVTESGIYVIKVVNSLKCENNKSRLIQVYKLPNTPIIYGNSKLCSNMLNQVYSTNQSSNHFEWSIDKGSIIFGGSTNEARINVTAKDSAIITLKETDKLSGCSSSNKYKVIVDALSTAPATVKVEPMGSQNDFLYAPGLKEIIRWGKINKLTNYIELYTSKNNYMYFIKIDTLKNWYFVDHGKTEECYTRSFYNDPAKVSGFEGNNSLSIHLFPNPAYSLINVESSFPFPVDLIIQNMDGKVLIKTNFLNKTEVDVSSLLPGFYFAKLVTNNKVVTYKFTKI